MIDINPSKSILDQVDEYLHENNNFIEESNNINDNSMNIPIHNDIHLLEKELSKSHRDYSIDNNNNDNNNLNNKTNGWISHSIQLDLDKLNDSFFQENSLDNSNNIPTLENISNSYYVSNHTLANTNYSPNVHNEVNDILTIPAVAPSFSPNASPLIAPNQASVSGIQVTPFMHPLTLKNDFGFDNINTTTNNNNNNNNHPSLADSTSIVDPLSTLNTSLNNIPITDDYGSKILPLTKNITSTSKNENSNNSTVKNKISISKKRHSITDQSTTQRSDQNSKVVKNSPYMKPNRSLRRFSRSKNSLENTPILPSTNITTLTTPVLNNSNSNNINTNNNNNNNQINAPGNVDEVTFQLPESSVISDKSSVPLNPVMNYSTTSPYIGNINTSNGVDTPTFNERGCMDVNNNNDQHKIFAENVKGSGNNIPGKRARSKSRTGHIKDESKREIHKMAEQERRNRLNNAIAELGTLIPEELKKTITIPSKATTAELACVYIRQLKDELSKMNPDSKLL